MSALGKLQLGSLIHRDTGWSQRHRGSCFVRFAGPGARFKRCQWIDDEPRIDDDCKCLKPTLLGAPYCGDHAKRAVKQREQIL